MTNLIDENNKLKKKRNVIYRNTLGKKKGKM